MLKRLSLFAACAATLSFNSCNTEFSVNGAYEITPVVMGLLDQSDSIHIFKITKAFLGEESNLVYAQNPDSNNFESVDGTITEFDEEGNETGRTWTLKDSVSLNKEGGTFYAPEQKIYYFKEANLVESYEYQLDAICYQSDTQSDTINARTTLINGFAIASPVVFNSNKIEFNSATVSGPDDYKSYKFTVDEGLNAALYNYKYTFRWREYYTDGSSQDFSATRNNGDEVQESPNKPNAHFVLFRGEEFFKWLGGYENTGGQPVSGVIDVDEDVTIRQVLGIDIKISIAHDNLDQFMDVTKPQTGLAQAQPEFTNVNGGLGIFSARHIFQLLNYRLSTNSMEELCEGQYTVQLGFCSNYPEDATTSYFCP